MQQLRSQLGNTVRRERMSQKLDPLAALIGMEKKIYSESQEYKGEAWRTKSTQILKLYFPSQCCPTPTHLPTPTSPPFFFFFLRTFKIGFSKPPVLVTPNISDSFENLHLAACFVYFTRHFNCLSEGRLITQLLLSWSDWKAEVHAQMSPSAQLKHLESCNIKEDIVYWLSSFQTPKLNLIFT